MIILLVHPQILAEPLPVIQGTGRVRGGSILPVSADEGDLMRELLLK
jgi:hypothetical protein